MLEALLPGSTHAALYGRLFAPGETLHAPHLIDVEVAHVIRRYAAGGDIDAERGRIALEVLASLSLRRYQHDIMLPRIWSLRHSLSAYDATYVALAEALDAPLVTRDKWLAGSHGHSARIDLV